MEEIQFFALPRITSRALFGWGGNKSTTNVKNLHALGWHHVGLHHRLQHVEEKFGLLPILLVMNTAYVRR